MNRVVLERFSDCLREIFLAFAIVCQDAWQVATIERIVIYIFVQSLKSTFDNYGLI